MSSTNSEFSTRPSQLDREAAERLKAYVSRNRGMSSTPVELSLEKALRVSAPESSSSFSRIIQLLIDEGMLRRVFRVYSSSSRAGLKDFDAIDDIPSELYDYTVDSNVEVSLNDVMVILKIIPMRTAVERH